MAAGRKILFFFLLAAGGKDGRRACAYVPAVRAPAMVVSRLPSPNKAQPLLRRLSRAAHAAASRAQDLLTTHPGVERCVAFSPDSQAVHAAVLPRPNALFTPWHGMHGNAQTDGEADETLIDFINRVLRGGEIKRISIVSSAAKLPAAHHERVVLNDVHECLCILLNAPAHLYDPTLTGSLRCSRPCIGAATRTATEH